MIGLTAQAFRRILLRGEIVVRVVRAYRTLGVATAAVSSDAGVGAAHARLADATADIGPAPAAASDLASMRSWTRRSGRGHR